MGSQAVPNTSAVSHFSGWTMLLVTHHLGDWASIIGLIISIIGFIATLWGVWRSKKASEAAAAAAQSVRDKINFFDLVSEYSSAIAICDEIKRHHRMASWQILPERYSALKRILIGIRAVDVGLSDVQRTFIQSSIAQLADLEQKVDKAADAIGAKDVGKLNALVSRQAGSLHEMVVLLKSRVGN